MKFFGYLILNLWLFFPFAANAQEKTTWDYPVKPGMEKWRQFKSMDDKYKSMSFADYNPLWKIEDQGRFVYKYQFFETLLAQPEVFKTLDSNGRKELLKEAIKKFDMKLLKEDLFGGATFAVNAWIMARGLYFEENLATKFTTREDIELSLKSGQLIDYDLMSIYEQSKTYTNGK